MIGIKTTSMLLVSAIACSSCTGGSKIVRRNGQSFLIDKRDGRYYPVSRINGKWWTMRNAAIGLPGSSYFPSPMHNPIGIDGRTYTWELAQQACPKGWRLPTPEELTGLFLTYGKVSYAGNVPYYKEKFGPYLPDSTRATYQAWLRDVAFHLPRPRAIPNATNDKEQRTLFWSSDSVGNRAYAVYWDNDQESVHFAAYPQGYYGFCRFVKIEKPGKNNKGDQNANEPVINRKIPKQEE